MATIKRFPFLRHLRAESSSAILQTRNGRSVRSGRGIAFYFLPDTCSVSEVPMDDQDLVFLFTGRSRDFQQVTAQGTVTYRVVDPEVLAQRIDCAISLRSGNHLKQPLEQIEMLIQQLAQQIAHHLLSRQNLEDLLGNGVELLRQELANGLTHESSGLAELGLEIGTIRVAAIQASAEVERALQTPKLEAIQQQADEASFERRALAVEKERAIQENELNNRVELAKRQTELIEQQSLNNRKQAEESAAVMQIKAEAGANRIRETEAANTEAEKARVGIYKALPVEVLTGLALKEFAGKLQRIDHVHLTPDLLGSLLADLTQSAGKALEQVGKSRRTSKSAEAKVERLAQRKQKK